MARRGLMQATGPEPFMGAAQQPDYQMMAQTDPAQYYQQTPLMRAVWEGRLPTWVGQAFEQDIKPAYDAWDAPDPMTVQGALDYAAMPAKAVTGMGKALYGHIKEGVTNPTMKNAGLLALDVAGLGGGLSRLGGVPKDALGANVWQEGLLQNVDRVPAPAIAKMAKDMGLPEDVIAGLIQKGHLVPPINPISPAGNEVGFPTPYSGSRRLKTNRLDELTSGFNKTTPAYGDVGTSDIADFQGKVLYPIPADRTSRDTIHSVGGVDVGDYNNPGGYTYMRQADTGGGGGFASGHGVMSRYEKLNNELGGLGVGVGTPMSGRGSDYARSGTDIAQRMGAFDNLPEPTRVMLAEEVNLKIAAGNKTAIEKAKEKAADEGVEYVAPKVTQSIKADFGDEFTARLDSEPMLRKAYMEATDLKRVSKDPHIVDAITLRHAITDDRFRYLPRGETDPLSGFDFLELKGKVMPSAQAPSPNPSYSHHQAGDYRPPLTVPVPRGLMFPEFTDLMNKAGYKPKGWNYMFDRIKPTQKVNQRVVDDVSKYTQSILRGGK